jgi:hypothetical protein
MRNPTTGQTESIQSYIAEVIWYTLENPTDTSLGLGEPGMRTLYRRTLLVLPGADPRILHAADGYDEFDFYSHFDISARRDATGRWIPNTLADLTKRENRFAHDPSAFPFALRADALRSYRPTYGRTVPGASPLRPFGEPYAQGHLQWGRRAGEDVIMSDILGFDIRAYDPQAPLYEVRLDPNTVTTVAPGDPGWPGPDVANPIGQGAYVDLAYAFRREQTAWLPSFPALSTTVVTPFSGQPRSLLNGGTLGAAGTYTTGAYRWFYDTWSFHYEHDGLNQDQAYDPAPNQVDEGTDGFNSPTAPPNTAVDDMSEYETSPPYPVPLQGIEIKIRAYERFSRQIREVTVRQNFATQ